jgi:hypothetical protein
MRRSEVDKKAKGADYHGIQRPVNDRGEQHRKKRESDFSVRGQPDRLSLSNHRDCSKNRELPHGAFDPNACDETNGGSG